MKTKLLSLFSLFALSASAQSITSYYGDNNTAYTLFSSALGLDHSASGANQTWSFSGLTTNGNVVDTNGTPSGTEATTFPNSTAKASTIGTENATATSSIIFSKEVAGVVSVTGAISDGLTLNYSTDNALVGTYPLAFGYSNTDNIAGTYNYTTYNGSFTGTLSVSVDAYGTLSLDPGPDNLTVTRLKTQQAISLSYPGFGNVGTVTINSYSYFTAGSNSPIFRTATTTMVVPLLSINQTKTRIEIMTSALGIDTVNRNLAQLVPNPVKEVLEVVTADNSPIRAIRVTDLNGRVVAQQSGVANINLSGLQRGVYFATVETNNGMMTQKIVKE